MVRFSVLPAAAVTLFLCGVQAGPCRPLTTTGVTSIAESSSTVVPDSTATSLDTTAVTTVIDATTTVQEESTTTTETSVAESLSTIASDTTIASVDVTTTTALVDPTTTAEAESTTTTAAPACVVTQLFANPGFDNSNGDIAPWTINRGVVTQTSPQSGPNALSYAFLENANDISVDVTQTLSNLVGTYEFSYYYRVVSTSSGADYTCDMQLKVGDVSLRGNFEENVAGWKYGSVTFNDLNVAQADVQLSVSCGGEYHQIVINLDSFGFTRVCSE